MPSSPNATEVASALLAKQGLKLQSLEPIQSLWAGYGEICRITATPDGPLNSSTESSRSVSAENSNVSTPQEVQSYILKLITPPPTKADDEGHTRKILSYRVEQYFYSHLAPQLPTSIPVAECLASINQHHADGTSTTAMIMNDLRQTFPVAGEKRDVLSAVQVNAALDWLAGFHGFWWSRVSHMDRTSLVLPPLEEVQRDDNRQTSASKRRTVWLNGGYTYLSTRRKEYASLAHDYDSEWNEPLTDWVDGEDVSISEIAAAFLAPRVSSGWSPIEGYQTLIHGDVKSENLFTSRSGKEVAFYDFQYTGLGLGVCDLAKLFTCSVPLDMLVPSDQQHNIPREMKMQDGERQLLERYWTKLRDEGKQEYKWEIFVRHWETALVDWLRFQASWGFWGNTEWLEARVRSILKDQEWRDALVSNVNKANLSQ
ncbi:Nn.00g079310.m01.CDS01 [Neocucurbitaria sp. VM-36]